MLVLFFFKQKTAYEMRISDWSSDVCSSDLVKGDGRIETLQGGGLARAVEPLQQGGDVGVRGDRLGEHDVAAPALALQARRHVHRGAEVVQPPVEGDGDVRSEEHTSELQSLMRISYAVFCLQKKKKNNIKSKQTTHEID